MSKKWETKSLEWLHKVREKLDKEISRSGLEPSQWIKSRKDNDIEAMCEKLGLQNYTIVKSTKRKQYARF